MISRFTNPNNGSGYSRGFSLVELMIVVTVLLIVAVMAVQSYNSTLEDAKLKKAGKDVSLISEGISQWNRYETVPFYRIRDLENLRGKYLQSIPKDPWGNDYQVDGTYVWSYGPLINDDQGQPYTQDDIKVRYDKEAIIKNPRFELSGRTMAPGSWVMNPRLAARATAEITLGSSNQVRVDFNEYRFSPPSIMIE